MDLKSKLSQTEMTFNTILKILNFVLEAERQPLKILSRAGNISKMVTLGAM